MHDEELVTVFTAQGMVQAQLIKGRLESAGCPVVLSYEAMSSMIPTTTNGLGQVLVKVPHGWEADARLALENIDFDEHEGEVIDFDSGKNPDREQS